MPGTGGDFSHHTVVPLYQTRSRLPALVAFYICASFSSRRTNSDSRIDSQAVGCGFFRDGTMTRK